MKLTVAVASHNPVKLRAAQAGFAAMFPGVELNMLPVSVPSGVAEQPTSDEETLQGALNRSASAQAAAPTANFWVGIEGGIAYNQGEMLAFAWVVVRSSGELGRARTAAFYLPPRVAELVRAGRELGEADDIVFERENSKQDNGAVGLLTGDVIDRALFYTHAVILALIPFKNEELYGKRPSGLP
jgi:inosine/xanthosine triphosphatase